MGTLKSASEGGLVTDRPPAGGWALDEATLAEVERAGASRTAAELFAVFGRVGWGYRRWLEASARGAGLSMARLRLLHLLTQHGPQRMTDLRRQLGVTARNVTQLVDGLEAEGLAGRTPHASDRRVTVVEVSQEGRAQVHRLFRAHVQRGAELFDRLDGADREELLRLLRLLADHLQEVVGETHPTDC